MASRSKRPELKRPDTDLTPYPQVVAALPALGLKCELTYLRSDGWCLDVYNGEELIARARSSHPTPECFPHLGRQIKRSLEKGGRV